MSAETLSLVAGTVLSLLFSYIPGLNTWFAALTEEIKRLIMLVLVVLVAASAYGLSCAGFGASLGLTLTCDVTGLTGLVQAVILCAIANQAVFKLTPRTKAVVKAKLLNAKFLG
jgi:hypothetical protein